ncbi:MAG: selenide, water dikinase SelD [Flavisolibacter sp.]|jgi:selenide,water dikinase
MQDEIRLTQFSKGGGCGCKIAPGVLQQMLQTKEHASFNALLVGNESNDDAAVFQVDDTRAIISTADFFLPIVDDAADFGKIAAANAISDVYAMGGEPMMAVAILGWPIDKIPVEIATKVLEGARSVCAQARIPLAGGHTIDSADPIFGLAVTGSVLLSNLKKNNTAKEGDHVFLTKPLGAGVLSTALKRGMLIPEHYNILLQQMTTLNDIGVALGKIDGVHAMTDVTGFGLLGHLIEMADGSNLSAELSYSSIKKIEGLDNYLQQRTIPDATFRNWNSYSKKVQFEKGVNVMEAFNVLPDPQTNGGLLVSVSEKGMDEVVRLFTQMRFDAYVQPVARFIKAGEKSVVVKP